MCPANNTLGLTCGHLLAVIVGVVVLIRSAP
jgi:hypothetical protein